MTEATVPKLEDTASQTWLIEQTAQLSEPPNRRFVAEFSDQERNPYRHWTPPAHRIRSYLIPDAALDGEFRGILTGAGWVLGTEYLMPRDIAAKLRIAPDRLVRDTDDRSPVVVGCNAAHANYFHWVTQALPAIDLAMRREGQARNARLALPPLQPWQEESLRLLGYGTARRLTLGDRTRQYAFARIEHSDVLTGSASFALSDIVAATFLRLRQNIEPPQTTDRKLYVARTDATRRPMRNERDIIDGLARRGFEILEAGSHSFTEQIGLFQSAALVVGPHGAGLTNIVFCRPGTTVYELGVMSYPNTCFCNLAYLARLQYWADIFPDQPQDTGPPPIRAWQSDTQAVLARVDEIERILLRQREVARQTPISAMDFLRGREGMLAQPQPTQISAAGPSRPGSWLRRLGLRRG